MPGTVPPSARSPRPVARTLRRGVLGAATVALLALGLPGSAGAAPFDGDVEAELARQSGLPAGIAESKIGWYLRLSGTDEDVLASRNATASYEPASAIKMLVAFAIMRRVETRGLDIDTAQVPILTPPAAGSCPTGIESGRTESIATAIRLMLQPSDNNRTLALARYIGLDELNATVRTYGLDGLSYAAAPTDQPGRQEGDPAFVGCVNRALMPASVDGNTISLAGLARLYSTIDRDDVLSPATRNRLENFSNGVLFGTTFGAVMDEERPAGMPDAQFSRFRTWSNYAKGGDYVAGINGRTYRWATQAGDFTIMRCDDDDRQAFQHYVLGVAFDGVEITTNAQATAVGGARDRITNFLARRTIRENLAGWSRCFLPRTTVTLAGADATYDGRPHPAVPTSTPRATVRVEYTKGATTTTDAPVRAGTYAARTRVTDRSFAGDRSTASVRISPRPVTLVAPDATITAGQAPPALAPRAVEGLADGDAASGLGTLTCTTPATAASAPGTYPITCSGVGNSDYTGRSTQGTLTVAPAPTPAQIVVPPATPPVAAPPAAGPPAASPPAAALRKATIQRLPRTLRTRGARPTLKFAVACPRGGAACRITVRVSGTPGGRILATRTLTVPAGSSRTVSARLKGSAVRAVGRRKNGRLRVALLSGKTTVGSATVRLRR